MTRTEVMKELGIPAPTFKRAFANGDLIGEVLQMGGPRVYRVAINSEPQVTVDCVRHQAKEPCFSVETSESKPFSRRLDMRKADKHHTSGTCIYNEVSITCSKAEIGKRLRAGYS